MIDSILNSITDRFYAWFGWVSDPFWKYVLIAIGIIFAVMLIAWFFGAIFPVLRPVAGVILLILTAGLIAYRKGENDQRAIDAKRAPKPKPKPRPPAWPPLFR